MKLWYSYLKELKLSSKGFYFYIEILMTLIILFVLLFVIPENMTSSAEEFIYFDLPEEAEAYYRDELLKVDNNETIEVVEFELEDDVIVEADYYESDDKKIYIFNSEEDLTALTEKERPIIGATISWDSENSSFKYDYYLQGYESERLRNLYSIIHSKDLEAIFDQAEMVEVESLESGYEALNSRQMAVPSLITFNGSLMGMFIMAAYIFLDKQEGIIKAYAVTASSVTQYLLSKSLMLMTVTFFTTLTIVIPVMGTQPNYFALVVLLMTSAFFASSVGLLISSYFDNMTQAFGVIYGVMMLFMLPAIAYFIPSWSPLWIKFIPVYYLIQGFKETILVNGDITYVLVSSGGFLVAGIALFMWATHQFKKTLTV